MTPRQRIMAELADEPLTARDLSKRIRISEKEVVVHLTHVAKSLHQPKRLVILPPVCNRCGFLFVDRRRFTSPSRCPRCRHEGISPPAFKIESK